MPPRNNRRGGRGRGGSTEDGGNDADQGTSRGGDEQQVHPSAGGQQQAQSQQQRRQGGGGGGGGRAGGAGGGRGRGRGGGRGGAPAESHLDPTAAEWRPPTAAGNAAGGSGGRLPSPQPATQQQQQGQQPNQPQQRQQPLTVPRSAGARTGVDLSRFRTIFRAGLRSVSSSSSGGGGASAGNAGRTTVPRVPDIRATVVATERRRSALAEVASASAAFVVPSFPCPLSPRGTASASGGGGGGGGASSASGGGMSSTAGMQRYESLADHLANSPEDVVSSIYCLYDEDVTKVIIGALDTIATADDARAIQRQKSLAVMQLIETLGEDRKQLIFAAVEHYHEVLLRLLEEFCGEAEQEGGAGGGAAANTGGGGGGGNTTAIGGGALGGGIRIVMKPSGKRGAGGGGADAATSHERWMKHFTRRYRQLTEEHELNSVLRRDFKASGAMLPANARVTRHSDHVQFFIPPPERRELPRERRISVQNELPAWTHPAFGSITHLNTIQTEVFEPAFRSTQNMLICAPTGAGKTLVALLVILRQIQDQMRSTDHVLDRDFKIVYVAPMKALAAEMAENFSKRLAPYMLKVREFTGDMQLSRKEIAETCMLVTTPEKWDVVTRKQADNELAGKTKLIILDEIHLLNDDRGPVLEALVARVLRQREMDQTTVQTRIVGLSATLPNYKDVARFLHVDEDTGGLKAFGPEYRPVPLEQTFMALPACPQREKEGRLDRLAYDTVTRNLREGHQVLVFVHSRRQTSNLAKFFLDRSRERQEQPLFGRTMANAASDVRRRASQLQGRDLAGICAGGIGVHHAGLLRFDRTIAEKLFLEGHTRVLICTATLAWGLNLPAHTVVIRGVEVYDSKKGGPSPISVLDVLQMFGRAGRPQFDDSGHGVIIAENTHIQNYIRLIAHALPIESQMRDRLYDHLNAEVHAGTVTSVAEGVKWLEYTYLWQRIRANPLAYGLTVMDVRRDPNLKAARYQIVADAATALHTACMVRFNPETGSLDTTDFGRIASHFYIEHVTMKTFQEKLRRADGSMIETLDMGEAFNLIACANEFAQLKMRPDELDELQKLNAKLPPYMQRQIRAAQESADETSIQMKVVTLLKAYIARIPIESHSLSCDINYVTQNAQRICRALFEIELQRGHPHACGAFLTVSKCVERRMFDNEHPLLQFGVEFTESVMRHLNETRPSLQTLAELSDREIGNVVHNSRVGGVIAGLVRHVPLFDLQTEVQPITRTVLRMKVTLEPQFQWSDKYHGSTEVLWLFVEDAGNNFIFHHEQVLVKRKDVRAINHYNEQLQRSNRRRRRDAAGAAGAGGGARASGAAAGFGDDDESSSTIGLPPAPPPIVINITVPIVPEYDRYSIRVVSDRWLGCEEQCDFSVAHLHLPDDQVPHTPLLPVHPVSKHAIPERYHPAYPSFSQFNSVQSQCFHVMLHTDHNVLLGAPTGSGKTICAELAMIRVFERNRVAKMEHRAAVAAARSAAAADNHQQQQQNQSDQHHQTVKPFVPEKIVYIAPLKALVKERMKDWRARLVDMLGLSVVELSGDVTPDISALAAADVLCATPEKWDGLSRNWQVRSYVSSVALVIFDEVHMLGSDRGPILEVIVSRMRYIGWHRGRPVRLIGLSTAVANPSDMAFWLGVSKRGALFNFHPSVRPVPMRIHIAGYPGRFYCPRQATMNKPTYNAIVEKSPTKPVIVFVSSRRQTRLTAMALINFLLLEGNSSKFVRMTVEELQRHLDLISDPHLKHCVQFGVGIHHAGLCEGDKAIMEDLYRSGRLQILVATSTLAYGVNFPAHLVVVKGTEFYDAKSKTYVDMPLTDVLQMIGRAGRPQFDTEGIAQVLCHEPKKSFFRKFLYDPFPVESALHKQLHAHINAEIVSGTIATRQDAVDYLTWTYLFRRLAKNPSYYGLSDGSPKALTLFLSTLVRRVLADLEMAGCLEPPPDPAAPGVEGADDEEEEIDPDALRFTVIGKICSYYYLSHETAAFFNRAVDPSDDHGVLLKKMCDAQEFSELPVRHNEDKMNMDLARLVPMGIDQRNADSPHVKAFLLFQAHYERARLPIVDYNTDQKSAIDNSIRVLQAMVDITANNGHLFAVLRIMNLMQCMVQARWWHSNTLLQLPHITEQHLRPLADAGITHVAHLANATIDTLTRFRNALQHPAVALEREHVDELVDVAKRLPLIDVNARIRRRRSGGSSGGGGNNEEDEQDDNAASSSAAAGGGAAAGGDEEEDDDEDETYEVRINLTRLSAMSKFVVAPKFAKQKDEQYWVVLGHEPTGELVALKRINRLWRRSTATLVFDWDPDLWRREDKLTLFVICDSYIGLDQQYLLKMPFQSQ